MKLQISKLNYKAISQVLNAIVHNCSDSELNSFQTLLHEMDKDEIANINTVHKHEALEFLYNVLELNNANINGIITTFWIQKLS